MLPVSGAVSKLKQDKLTFGHYMGWRQRKNGEERIEYRKELTYHTEDKSDIFLLTSRSSHDDRVRVLPPADGAALKLVQDSIFRRGGCMNKGENASVVRHWRADEW